MTEISFSNVQREMEVYGYDSVTKSHCRMCHGGCGVLVYVKNGRVEKIAGDPDCSGNTDIDDVVYLVMYVFSGGYAPCDPDGDGTPDC